jgi:Histidine kinase/Histidine kinase-, DNA gyrase B-, and HSP90-like ATPase
VIPDCDNLSRAIVHAKRPRGELLPRARMIPLTMAAILAVATAIECHAQASGIESFLSWGFSLAYGCALWFWWALVVYLLWRSTSRWPSALRVSPRTLVVHPLIAVGVVALHLGFLQAATQLIVRLGPEAVKAEYRGLEFFSPPRFGMELLLYGLCWLACAAVNTQLVAQHDSMRSLELERQLSSAHLRALQMQLEPHFLFNTLNALTTLVELGRREQALETLEHLNTVLKLVLKRNTPSKIPLAQELEVLESYLAIEQVRFADRLRVNINLDPDTLDGLVPCFLLQPIVENAIRHGIARCEDSGWIETSAQRVGTRMRLQVRDNGPGMNGRSANGFGLGLSNTKERLAHFYQNDYEFRAFQPESGGFQVSITIPYEKATS